MVRTGPQEASASEVVMLHDLETLVEYHWLNELELQIHRTSTLSA
jgi:hypothetical protein